MRAEGRDLKPIHTVAMAATAAGVGDDGEGDVLTKLRASLRSQRFAFVPAGGLYSLLERHGAPPQGSEHAAAALGGQYRRPFLNAHVHVAPPPIVFSTKILLPKLTRECGNM